MSQARSSEVREPIADRDNCKLDEVNVVVVYARFMATIY
jgi:hypothetical protein